MKRSFFSTALFSLLSLTISCNQAEGETETVPAGPVATSPSSRASIPHKDTAYKTIYLSFDDGPLEGSEDINDAVVKEQVKINVFIVGQHALSNSRMQGYYRLYLANKLIEVGNHSFTHAHNQYKKFYDNPAAVLQDFLKCQQELKIPNKYARQPGRNQWRLKDTAVNDVSSGAKSADLLFQNGFRVFGWDIEWQHDSKTGVPVQTVDDIVELIDRRLDERKTMRPGHLVLLSHDEMFRNGWEESELRQLIIKLRNKGNYRFDHLSNYPE